MRKFRRSISRGEFQYGVEQPPAFYDETFRRGAHWKEHYTDSHYYPLWTVIADRIRRSGAARVLDIGCGPGQVACLLRDMGIDEYIGIDFSPERVAHARAVCPEYTFYSADVFATELLEDYPYQCVLLMEFLEHIERDLDVLERIRRGSLTLATVPNFAAAGHVRYFANCEQVQSRYGHYFSEFDVTEILSNQHGKTYFILQGIRN